MGIINLYVTSYYKLTNDFSLTVQSTGVAFPIMFLMIGLGMRLGLYLSSITHPLIVLSTCKTIEALPMFVASFMPDIWLFILFYGIVFGLTAGIAFMIPMFECNKYLVGKRMMVNGIILMGTGGGSMVFGMYSYSYLNPADISPLHGYYVGDSHLEQIALKCPVLVRWLALLYLIIGFAGIALISPVCLRNRRVENLQKQQKQKQIQQQKTKQEKNNLKLLQGVNINNPNQIDPNQKSQDNQAQLQNSNLQINKKNPLQITGNQFQQSDLKIYQNPEQAPRKNNETVPSGKEDKQVTPQKMLVREPQSILEAMKSRVFWVSVSIIILTATGCFMINGNYKTYVKAKIKDDKFLTIVGVIGAVGNGFSRYLWNLYFSKTGFKTTLLTILTLSIIVFSTIRFSVESKAAYLIEVFLINCCLGGILVSTPTSLLSIYGPTIGAMIYGVFWEFFGIANMLGYIYVSQLSKIIGFENVIYICLGMSCLAVPLVIMTKFQGPWLNDTSQLQYYVDSELQKHKQIETVASKENKKKDHDKKFEQKDKIDSQILATQIEAPLYIELKVSSSKNDRIHMQSDEIQNQSAELLIEGVPNQMKKKHIQLKPISQVLHSTR